MLPGEFQSSRVAGVDNLCSLRPRPPLPLPRMARGALHPLLLLLPLVLSAAASDNPHGGPQSSGLSGTLELLWSNIGRIVRSAVELPIAGLDGRLTGIQVQLNSATSELQDQLNSVKSELEGQLSVARSELQNQLDGVETKLETQIQSAVSKMDKGVKSFPAQQEAQTSTITDRLSQLESAVVRVQSQLESRLEQTQAQLESKLEQSQHRQQLARDCSDLPASAESGVHLLQPGLRQPVPAFCDQETDGGGWTVIQRRADIQPRQDFYLGWEAYKWGFGFLDAEFWWGLEHLWRTTSLLDRRYQLRFDMEDFDGDRRYAVFANFSVAPEEDSYRLTADNYTGNAGDSFSYHSGKRFSTTDRDQDIYAGASCAQNHKGGWWYGACRHSNLNSRYLSGNHSSYADGVNWAQFRGNKYSLKFVEMKIRPIKSL